MDTPIVHHAVYTERIDYTKANGTTSNIEVPFFEIPAGTLLFRGVQLPNPKKDEDPRLFVRDWLGYPSGERFCMTPVHNTFFYTSPYVPFGAHTVGEWFNAILVYQTVKNLRVVSMISPSKWVRGGKEIKALDGTAPIQRCDKFDYTCFESETSKEARKEKELKAFDNCIRPEFAESNKVSGWMAIADYDSLDNFKEGLRGKQTTMGKYIMELESRLRGKGIELLTSTYTDGSNHRGFPEIVLFPWSPHPGTENQYTEARTEEDAADAIAEMSDKFNYLPMACITERGILEAFTGDFKAGDLPKYATSAAPGPLTRKAVDKHLSQYLEKLQTEGVEIEGLGRGKMMFDTRTGFFVMNNFTPEIQMPGGTLPYTRFCAPLETPEERERVTEYKIKYRTFDATKLLQPDVLINGGPLEFRSFVFERPPELYQQYKELGIKFPQTFIPYILSATERYYRNMANRKATNDPRGAEEALRRAEEARVKIQESLAIIAKKKGKPAAEEGKEETTPETGARTPPVSPPYAPTSPASEEERIRREKRAANLSRLPPGWQMYTHPEGYDYYVGPDGQSQWQHPADASTSPVYASASPAYFPSSPKYASRFTGEFQSSIPIIRTAGEAITIGLEVIAQPKMGEMFPVSEGISVDASVPFDMKEESLRRTIKYLFDYLHHSCYMLCVVDHIPYLFKLEGGGMPAKLRGILETEMAAKGITDINLDNTRIMQCIIKPYQEQATTAEEWLAMLKKITEAGFQLPNGIFILNLSDSTVLRTDGNEPWTFFTRVLEKMPKEFRIGYVLPILSYSGHVQYDDIPIPNFDDIFEIKRNSDGTVDIKATMKGEITTDWEAKKGKAVFRGGTTGCGYTPETNQRLKLTSSEFVSTLENADMLDVGITTITKQYKMDPVNGLGKVNPADISVVDPYTMVEQSKFKYIIHVDGNVFAYRLLKTMLLNSCILRVMSSYIGWADSVLRGFKVGETPDAEAAECHYIVVLPDLSNLDQVLGWCEENEDGCAVIAENGRQMAGYLLQERIIYASFINRLNFVTRVSMSGGGPPPKKEKKTRKQKSRSKHTRKVRKQETPLVLAQYRGGGIESEMEEYIQTTMKKVWSSFLQKNRKIF